MTLEQNLINCWVLLHHLDMGCRQVWTVIILLLTLCTNRKYQTAVGHNGWPWFCHNQFIKLIGKTNLRFDADPNGHQHSILPCFGKIEAMKCYEHVAPSISHIYQASNTCGGHNGCHCFCPNPIIKAQNTNLRFDFDPNGHQMLGCSTPSWCVMRARVDHDLWACWSIHSTPIPILQQLWVPIDGFGPY